MNFSRVYRRFGGIVPKTTMDRFEKKLKHGGIKDDAWEWLGARVLLSVLFGLIVILTYINFYPIQLDLSVVVESLSGIQPDNLSPTISLNEKQSVFFNNIILLLQLFIVGFLILCTIVYLKLYFAIVERSHRLEKLLPDFLMLVVSNLRAGMVPFSAFVNAARPEFGELHEEVRIATAKVGGKGSLDEALLELSSYFDSRILRRTVLLFVKGIRSGGQLARLLSSSAEEVRKIQDLRAELVTATRMYSIFLGFIVIILMPFLLSVSTHFIIMFLSIQEDVGTGFGTHSMGGSVPALGGEILITPEEIFYISLATLLITSMLVSALIGIISRGKTIYGIKYFPVFAVASCASFILAKEAIGGMLSAFLGV